jgi:hypothetical protein
MSTVVQTVLDRVAATPSAVASRHFHLGIWEEASWSALRDEAIALASGFAALGVGPGQRVAIVSANSPVWIATAIAVQGLGASVVALPTDFSPETTTRLIDESGASVVVVGDQEQFDKIERRPAALRTVVVINTRGMRHLDVPGRADARETATLTQVRMLRTGTDLSVLGAATADGEALVAGRVEDRTVTLERYTHRELLAHGQAAASTLALGASEHVLALRTLAEPLEFALGVTAAASVGYPVHFGEPGLEQQAVREIRPTVLHADPEWLGACAGDFESQRGRATGLKGRAVRALKERPLATTLGTGRFPQPTRVAGIGLAVAIFVWLLVSPSLNDFLRLGVALAATLVVLGVLVAGGHAIAGPLRRRYGLSRCRAVLTDEPVDGAPASLLAVLAVPNLVVDVPAGSPLVAAATSAPVSSSSEVRP